MAYKGIEVNIRPHVKIDGVKNTEYYIFGLIGDRYSPKSYKNIGKKMGKKIKEQQLKVLIVNLDNIPISKQPSVAQKIKRYFNQSKLEHIIIITKKRVIHKKISRKNTAYRTASLIQSRRFSVQANIHQFLYQSQVLFISLKIKCLKSKSRGFMLIPFKNTLFYF